MQPATASRKVRRNSSARPPQTNSTRMPPANFSADSTAITPMLPVRETCVPPHADRSKPSTSMTRSVPPRPGSLRSGSAAASSSDTNRMPTGRSSQTMRLASASAAAIASAVSSIVEVDRGDDARRGGSRRCGPGCSLSNAADRMCWPVCCCM